MQRRLRNSLAVLGGGALALLAAGCSRSDGGPTDAAGAQGVSLPAATGTSAGNPSPAPTFASSPLSPAEPVDTLALRELGRPIPGLTPSELAAFERGRVLFEKRFTPEEGLGPFYNAVSCVSCHSAPETGGASRLYRNFYLAAWGNSTFQDVLPPFLSLVIPAFGSGATHMSTTAHTLEGGRTPIPDTYQGYEVTVAQRNAIPVFGVGLFEFVSNTEILSRVDPFDQDGNGISGRHNLNLGTVGRFGMKAQSNNIELFTRGPLQNQMGITSDPFLGTGGIVSLAGPLQVGSDFDPTVDSDPVPDPEISHEDLGDLIAFSRFLAPPKPLPFDASAANGEVLFDQIGCTLCHVPTLASSRGPVNAYTDLLLHNLGTELADNLRMGGNGNTSLEFRTQPLWGVSLFPPFLHDGRAETLEEAILWHGGEANNIRAAYEALTPAERADILSFLEHI